MELRCLDEPHMISAGRRDRLPKALQKPWKAAKRQLRGPSGLHGYRAAFSMIQWKVGSRREEKRSWKCQEAIAEKQARMAWMKGTTKKGHVMAAKRGSCILYIYELSLSIHNLDHHKLHPVFKLNSRFSSISSHLFQILQIRHCC